MIPGRRTASPGLPSAPLGVLTGPNNMLTRVYSAALYGVDAIEVEIEVDERRSKRYEQVIVGLPDAAVRESKDRVLTALANSKLRSPGGHTTINLAPANLRKEGPSFDLPIALGMAALTDREFDHAAFEKCAIVGELALNGRVRAVKGVLSLTLEAKRRGRKAMLVPQENAAEAAVVEGIYVYGIPSLSEAVSLLKGEGNIKPEKLDHAAFFGERAVYDVDFSDVKGQLHARRALEVAIAGGHNALLVGPPGTGKSMMAKRTVTIMPPMTEEEAIETTKIHSVAGMLGHNSGFVATRPFRSPHHTISDAGLLGGSSHPSPGEVSLAHNGILFLDELPEFRRSTLEVMRQPLEDGRVTISRAAATFTFPSRFNLVAAMNPCKCGYLGDPKRDCSCSTADIENYRNRISGPLLDRIDLHVEVPAVNYKELANEQPGETSEAMRSRVVACRQIQLQRFENVSAVTCNGAMPPKIMRQHCKLDSKCSKALDDAMEQLNFSARAHDRILKVARTLADLEASPAIRENDILEAIQYRTLDRQLWR